MNEVRLVWFEEGKSFVCYPLRDPYTKDDVIKEGIPYEEWMVILKGEGTWTVKTKEYARSVVER